MRIVCLTHVPFEGPGEIAAWAAARGHSFEILPLYDQEAVHPGEFEMLVVMGGPMSVDEEAIHPWLAAEKRLVKVALESGGSVLGVCLGAQILAQVLGAQVMRAEETEIGWYPVTQTPSGVGSRVFGVLPGRFDALHWHGATFETPPGCPRLASSAATVNQAFEYDDGRAVGLQFHLELAREPLAVLIQNASRDLRSEGPWISSPAETLAGTERFIRSRDMLFALLDAMAARMAGRPRP